MRLSLIVVGCGGSASTANTDRAAQSRTITVATDPQLSALWAGAQQVIDTDNIVLNAAAVAVQGVSPEIYPPDPRALRVLANGVTVTTIPDLNPGAITCPNNAEGVKYCHSNVQGSSIFVATSNLYNPDATGYEMQNIILERLGYNVTKR